MQIKYKEIQTKLVTSSHVSFDKILRNFRLEYPILVKLKANKSLDFKL